MPEAFLEEMKILLEKNEYQQLLTSYQEVPKKSIRLQLEKITPIKWETICPFQIEPIPIVKGGYYVDAPKIGNHPYHHAGLFYVQEPSAMLPPIVITLKENSKILDLCAAPGGKTMALSNQVPKGFVVANEINYKRAKKLLSNVERLGLKNVIISSQSSQELKRKYQEYFDAILIDAPCSGEGMFRKDETARKEWSKEKVEELSVIQQQLLEDSAAMLKEDGYLIYSTCTFSLEEDEKQIIAFLKKHHFEIIEISSAFDSYTKKGIVIDSNYQTEKARRCYPYLYGEGQFMVVLKKKEKHHPMLIENVLKDLSTDEKKVIDSFIQTSLNKNHYVIRKYQENIVVLPFDIEVPRLTLLSCCVKMGEIEKGRFIPHHQFVKTYGNDFKNQCRLSLNDPRIEKYLKGEEIEAEVEDGYGVIMIDGYPLGLFKSKNGKLKNHYPKGLRYQD